ncbi:protein late bloomer isoform X1 [Drosophila pseudoobscura]|uniref:Protein late bloomer isoform X1 n=1 Tax=Drosophila pseudoobscura pseudoobscura TaxID=46245 RepID=A0A6I8VU87_DROPS|nr:protein late bloomer isoform X1 [Drosophila pseudoobscura]
MGCGTVTIMYMVFLFNTLSSVLGLVIAVVNSLALKEMSSEGKPFLILFLLVGGIMFVVSFLGCLGAIKANVCMTWTYAITVLAAGIITITLLCILAGHTDEKTLAKNQLDAAWAQEKNHTNAMSILQSKLHCCGINGPGDYTAANLTLPFSCFYPNSKTKVYEEGCFSELTQFYVQVLKGSKVAGWIFLAIECGTFVCAVLLDVTFKYGRRRCRTLST